MLIPAQLDGVPILVDVTGKMDLMPTIFTLWKVRVPTKIILKLRLLAEVCLVSVPFTA